MDKDTLLRIIDQRREEIGWNWTDVAVAAGMTRQQLQSIRISANPSFISLLRIMAAVGLTVVVTGVPGFNPEKPKRGPREEGKLSPGRPTATTN